MAGRKNHSGRPTGKHRFNLFTGFITDAAGNALHLQTPFPLDDRLSYLAGPGKGAVRVRYQDAEDGILDALAMLRVEDVIEPTAQHLERERRIAELTTRRVALDHRRQLLVAAAADPDEDLATNQAARKAVADALATLEEELRRLKLESQTGKAEHLSETQTLAQLYRAAAGDEKAELARRIKAALPAVVRGITVEAVKVSAKRQRTRVTIELRGGGRRAFVLLPGEHTPLHIDALASEDS